MGIISKRWDDGHPIHKGGFSLTKTNENVSGLNLPYHSHPTSLLVHDIVSLVIGEESAEAFATLMQPVGNDTDIHQDTCLASIPIPYAKLVSPIKAPPISFLTNRPPSLLEHLVQYGVLTLKDCCQIRKQNGVTVDIFVHFQYQADWKGLLCCFVPLPGLFSPFSLQFNENRKNEDLGDPSKFFWVDELFDNMVDIYRDGLMRSDANLAYMKSIHPDDRRADATLHGQTGVFRGLLLQEVLYAGMDQVGLKGKIMNCYFEEGVLSSPSGGTVKAPTKLSHKRFHHWKRNYGEIDQKVLSIINKKEKTLQKSLNNNRRKKRGSQTAMRHEKIQKKIQICQKLKKMHESLFPGFRKLFDILDKGRSIRTQTDYFAHHEESIRKEFILFPEIRDEIIPLLRTLQFAVMEIVQKTKTSSMYSNYLFREFLCHLCKHFNDIDDQISAELMNMVLNRGHYKSSHFGGKERKQPLKLRSAEDARIKVSLTRKYDTLIGVLARWRRRKKIQTKEEMHYV